VLPPKTALKTQIHQIHHIAFFFARHWQANEFRLDHRGETSFICNFNALSLIHVITNYLNNIQKTIRMNP
jgi:hypothetical protein